MRKGLLIIALLASASLLSAQVRGRVIVPDSSIARPGDAGVRAHTTHLKFVPEGAQPNSASPTGETPASLGCVYKIVANPMAGCPKTSTSNPRGGSGIIVIVDAFHYPTAQNDMDVFSTTFGLPRAVVHTVFASGQPQQDCGWNEEASLDIEWAHAMAPRAVIVLMEAKTNSFNDLMTAVDKANAIIAAHGGKGEVTMSWQGGEFGGETALDAHFSGPGIVYFASSGDAGGQVGWPSTSPAVVSAGGTTVHRNGAGSFVSEIGWSGSGGGDSGFEARPSFQDAIQNIVGTKRGTPDYSYDADPATGVSVYNTAPACGGQLKWQVFGGTSVSSPALAGIVNLTGHFNASSNAENTEIYSNLGNAADFRDITQGQAGSHQAGPGWDFVTGVGSNVGKNGK
jgi:kumamolisin